MFVVTNALARQDGFAPRWQGSRPRAPAVKLAPPRRPTKLHSAPSWNPQNTPNPQVMPSAELSAEQAVRVQLDALMQNDQPWANHGVQTMYEFGDDIGGLDPSFYFGFRKDLYHMDHFMGQFANQLGDLINCTGYRIEAVEEGPGAGGEAPGGGTADAVVHAVVQLGKGGGEVGVQFRLRRRTFGSRKGAYMTAMLRKLPPSA